MPKNIALVLIYNNIPRLKMQKPTVMETRTAHALVTLDARIMSGKFIKMRPLRAHTQHAHGQK